MLAALARPRRALPVRAARRAAGGDRRGAGARCASIVRTPLGPLAELRGRARDPPPAPRRRSGTCHLVTDERRRDARRAVATTRSGTPLAAARPRPTLRRARVARRGWGSTTSARAGTTRRSGRFLTPDTLHRRPRRRAPRAPARAPRRAGRGARADAGRVAAAPASVRDRYAYCANDPVNRFDPNGHWSFGGVLLTLLGAIWTLPNTLFGLVVEITCLVGEVVRWLGVAGNRRQRDLGDAGLRRGGVRPPERVRAGLHAAAGWARSPACSASRSATSSSSTSSWEQDPASTRRGDVFPPAYDGKVAVPGDEALYEHELRHTNQYGWFGPFFLLAYLLDAKVIRRYDKSFLEQDALRPLLAARGNPTVAAAAAPVDALSAFAAAPTPAPAAKKAAPAAPAPADPVAAARGRAALRRLRPPARRSRPGQALGRQGPRREGHAAGEGRDRVRPAPATGPRHARIRDRRRGGRGLRPARRLGRARAPGLREDVTRRARAAGRYRQLRRAAAPGRQRQARTPGRSAASSTRRRARSSGRGSPAAGAARW